MLNAGGVEPQKVELLASYQEVTPINRTNILIDQYQQVNHNPSKRSKGGDDSFEHEHRLAPGRNQYFYDNMNRLTTNTSSTTQIIEA